MNSELPPDDVNFHETSAPMELRVAVGRDGEAAPTTAADAMLLTFVNDEPGKHR
jgi:hypothetical protein